MVTCGLHTDGDESGMLVYGFKFRAVPAKSSQINTKIYHHCAFRGKCLLLSSKFPLFFISEGIERQNLSIGDLLLLVLRIK
jgi:hypothetical protein